MRLPIALLALCLTAAIACMTLGWMTVGMVSGQSVLYLGAIATAIAYLLWTYALRHLSVRDSVLITMVEPVTATILANVMLDEPMSAITIAGIAAVSAGILIASSTDARPTRIRDETAPVGPHDADEFDELVAAIRHLPRAGPAAIQRTRATPRPATALGGSSRAPVPRRRA